jgi:23S rRNA pseudouridine1911/1915/1917 synthase
MNNKTIEFFTNNEDVGKRLDILLSEKISHLTRSNLKKIIESNNVKVDNLVVSSPSKKIQLSETITVKLIEEPNENIKPTKIKLDIIFEDKDLLIINKPAGMVVHPGAGNYVKTLANALVYKYKNNLSDVNGNNRPGIVHRIDKETSGLLVVAKNNKTHSELGKQFSDHTIERTYKALVWGVLRPLEGKISNKIARSKKNRQLMSVTEIGGKKAVTNYSTKKVFNIKDIPRISLIECTLETGRTHQIRVHMSSKGNSLLGDNQYGKKNLKFKKINSEFEKKLKLLNRQALHAKSIGFKHPTTCKFIKFESDLPDDFKKMLDLLNKLSH